MDPGGSGGPARVTAQVNTLISHDSHLGLKRTSGSFQSKMAAVRNEHINGFEEKLAEQRGHGGILKTHKQ